MLFVVALGVGGYILSNQRFYLPNWVPVVGSDFVDYKAEFSTAQVGHAGPGPDGRHRRRAGRRDRRASSSRTAARVVTMKIRPQVRADLQGRDGAAAAQDRPEGHDRRAHAGLEAGGQAPTRATRSRSPNTLPDVNARRDPRGARRATRATTSSCWSPARGQGLGGNGKNLSADLPPLRARRPATSAQDHRRCSATRRNNIRAVDPQLRRSSSRRSASKDKQLADARRLLQRRLQGASPARTRTCARRCSVLPPHAARHRRGARQGRQARPTSSARRSARCGPGARALGPSLKQTRPFLRDDDAGHPRPAAAVRARRAADGAGAAAGGARPGRRDAGPRRRRFKVVNYLLNELAYNPPGDDEGYLFWVWPGSTTSAPTIFSTQDAHGPIRRGSF